MIKLGEKYEFNYQTAIDSLVLLASINELSLFDLLSILRISTQICTAINGGDSPHDGTVVSNSRLVTGGKLSLTVGQYSQPIFKGIS